MNLARRAAIFAGVLFSAAFLSCSKESVEKDSKKSADPVVLRFWYAWGGYEGKFLESLIEEFNRTHPNIQVKGTFFNIGDKLLAAIAGGKPPDVATVWDYMLPTMGESGCFLPLEDRLRKAGAGEDAFLPNVWEYGMYGKHKWGIPATLNTLGIYYNKALVRQAGFDPEKPPQTIAELDQWANQLMLRSPSGSLERIGFVPITANCWIWNFGGETWNAAERRFTLDRPENVRALEWMKSRYDVVGMDDFRRFSAGFGKLESPQNPLIIQKMAMKEDGQWVIQFLREYDPEGKLDYGVMPFPSAVPGQPGATSIFGSFWVIPQGTRHPEEAWEFLRWLIDPPQSARFCARLRNIPPLRATLSRPEFQELLRDAKFKSFTDMILEGRGRCRPALPVGQELEDKLAFQLEVVLGGKTKPKDYLSSLNKDMTHKLDLALKLLDIGAE